jgi:hypothetical protein
MFGLDDAVAAGLKVLDKFIPDPDAKARAEQELREALFGWDSNQTEVNRSEALHANLFVAGWRPFIGWTCGAAFAYHYVLQPLLVFLAALNGMTLALPAFAMDSLFTILVGLLGLGGLRTYEKFKGVAR